MKPPDVFIFILDSLRAAKAIPALFDALFRRDPGAALIDASALIEQIKQDYTLREHLAMTAEERQVILHAADTIKHRLQVVYLATGASQAEIDDFWVEIEDWARNHPIAGNFAVRDSTESLFAASTALIGGGLGAAISSAQEEMADFAVRADIYAEHLPRQARWQAQLLVEELLADGIVNQAVEEVGTIPLSIEEIPIDIDAERQALIEDLRREGFLVGRWVQNERDGGFAFVSTERQVVLDHLTEERIAILEAIKSERYALIEALDQQRSAAFEDLQKIVASTLVQSRQDLIDHLIFRSAQLLAVVLPLLLIGGLILVWFARRPRG